jgi:hypothetical protein
MTDRLAHGAETLEMAMAEIAKGDTRKAAELVRERYPFVPPVERRGISLLERMSVFLRDGFIDRYSGQKLFFPPVLEVISLEIPEAFPSYRHGNAAETHIAHWELYPSVDHLVPLARGGAHKMANWVTTSMSHNQQKSNLTLEDMGWELLDPSSIEVWDGGLAWFFNYVTGRRSELLSTDNRSGEWPSNSWFRQWHKAALRATEELPKDVHRSWKGTIRP